MPRNEAVAPAAMRVTVLGVERPVGATAGLTTGGARHHAHPGFPARGGERPAQRLIATGPFMPGQSE